MTIQKETLNNNFKKTLQALLSYENDITGVIGIEHSDLSLSKHDLKVKATRLVLISDIFRQVFNVVSSDGKVSLQEQAVFLPLAKSFLHCIKPFRMDNYGEITESDIKSFLTKYKSDSGLCGFKDEVKWRVLDILGQTGNLKTESIAFCLYYKLLLSYVTFFVESSDDPDSSRIVSDINRHFSLIVTGDDRAGLSEILNTDVDSLLRKSQEKIDAKGIVDVMREYWVDLPDFINDELWSHVAVLSVTDGYGYKCQLSVLLDYRKNDLVTQPNKQNLKYTRDQFQVDRFDLFSMDLPVPKEIVTMTKSYKIAESDYITSCLKCSESGKIKCKSCHGTKTLSCDVCNGHGKLTCGHCSGTGTVQRSRSVEAKVKCTLCLGSGRFPAFGPDSNDCNMCNGRGERWGSKTVNYTENCSVCSSSGRVSCANCNGSGKLKCQICDPRGLIVCNKCEGCGTFHNYYVCIRELVNDDKFQYMSDILNRSDSLFGILPQTDWSQLVVDETFVSSRKPEILHSFKPLSESCDSLYSQMVLPKLNTRNGRPLIYETLIYEEPLKTVVYSYDSKKFELALNPICNQIYSVKSPFSDLIEDTIADAISCWSEGKKKEAKSCLFHARQLANSNEHLQKRYRELEKTIPVSLIKYAEWTVPNEVLFIIPLFIILAFIIFLFTR